MDLPASLRRLRGAPDFVLTFFSAMKQRPETLV
jgi:hypothetical protein